MKKKTNLLTGFLIFIFIISLNEIQSQKRYNIWYFGENAGLDFNTPIPSILTNGQINTYEGCSTISDTNGNILFYTDGVTVYNKNHQIMEDGQGLLGNSSSTQSALIVPKPQNDNLFYIFTVDFVDNHGSFGFRYSEVDLTYNAGLGKVLNKNTLLNTPTTEKIAIAKHSNNIDYWVVSHGAGNNRFYSYHINSSGINLTPIINTIGSVHSIGFTLAGHLKFSHNYNKLTSTQYGSNGNLELFDFNNSNGQISNAQMIDQNDWFYGVEFSQNNSKLYATCGVSGKLYQYDLLATNITNSRVLISNETNTGAMQMAKDKKIYVSIYTHNHISIINDPDNVNCNFVKNGIFLNGKKCLWGLPNFLPYNFADTCNLIANFNTSTLNICVNKLVNFTNTTQQPTQIINWYINDTLISQTNNFNYTFLYHGTFAVKLVVSNLNCKDSIINYLNVYENYQKQTFDTICQGEFISVGNKYYSTTGTYYDTFQSSNFCDSVIITNLFVKNVQDINLGSDFELCENKEITFNIDTVFKNILWSNGSSNNFITIDTPNIYWVSAIYNSCIVGDTINIIKCEENEIWIPNVFTPNNDGVNDSFEIKYLGINSIKGYIYNRWGLLIYEWEGIEKNKFWNGNVKNKEAPEGVYYYIIEYSNSKNKEFKKHGVINLIR